MRLLNGYIFRTTTASIIVVLLVITSLDILAKIIDELGSLTDTYTFTEVLIYSFLAIPSTVHQYMPFAVLVGGLVGLGSLASTSELVVMRAAGVSLLRLIWAVIQPAMCFIVLMLLFAEYVIPVSDQYAENRRSSLMQQGNTNVLASQGGLWSRENNTFMHFNGVQANGKLSGITRYQYDDQQRLVAVSFAKVAFYIHGQWYEEGVVETTFAKGDVIKTHEYSSRVWETELSPNMLTILVQDIDNLAMTTLYTYAAYLGKQDIDNRPYLLAYWEKVLQPLVIISLLLVAASFIFGPLREATMGYRIFTGVVIGVVFQLAQKLLGPVSLLYGIPPFYAVLLPIGICMFFGLFLLNRAR